MNKYQERAKKAWITRRRNGRVRYLRTDDVKEKNRRSALENLGEKN